MSDATSLMARLQEASSLIRNDEFFKSEILRDLLMETHNEIFCLSHSAKEDEAEKKRFYAWYIRMKDAVDYAHVNGFEWPSDPFQEMTESHIECAWKGRFKWRLNAHDPKIIYR